MFLAIEGRFAKAPLMPLRLFRSRSLATANVIMMLVGASTFAMWFFFSLYLQLVRGYSPLHAGLIFLPMTLSIVSFRRGHPHHPARRGQAAAGGRDVRAGRGDVPVRQLSPTGSYLGEMLAPSLIASIAMPFAFIPSTIRPRRASPRRRRDWLPA